MRADLSRGGCAGDADRRGSARWPARSVASCSRWPPWRRRPRWHAADATVSLDTTTAILTDHRGCRPGRSSRSRRAANSMVVERTGGGLTARRTAPAGRRAVTCPRAAMLAVDLGGGNDCSPRSRSPFRRASRAATTTTRSAAGTAVTCSPAATATTARRRRRRRRLLRRGRRRHHPARATATPSDRVRTGRTRSPMTSRTSSPTASAGWTATATASRPPPTATTPIRRSARARRRSSATASTRTATAATTSTSTPTATASRSRSTATTPTRRSGPARWRSAATSSTRTATGASRLGRGGGRGHEPVGARRLADTAAVAGRAARAEGRAVTLTCRGGTCPFKNTRRATVPRDLARGVVHEALPARAAARRGAGDGDDQRAGDDQPDLHYRAERRAAGPADRVPRAGRDEGVAVLRASRSRSRPGARARPRARRDVHGRGTTIVYDRRRRGGQDRRPSRPATRCASPASAARRSAPDPGCTARRTARAWCATRPA